MLELWVSRDNAYIVYDKISNKRTLWMTTQELAKIQKQDFIDNFPSRVEHMSYPLSITSIEEISSLPAIHPELFI